jgi:DNA-nicking Smr family endonuclease
MRKRKEHALEAEDRVLWEKVARTVTPLGPTRAKMSELETVDFEKLLEAPSAKNPVAPAAKAPPKPKPVTTPESIDQPIQRRIAKGKVAIEARIDLHGMTQDEAHGLLMSFIHRAAQRHLRTVLVITGKGRSPKSEGALKRAVPLWLAQLGFAVHVSGYADAAQSHGGEGALYVRLRKPVTR